MQSRPKISDAEWQVMKVLWQKSPVTANEIVEKLTAETAWKPKTVRTLISRLTAKDAIGFDKTGRQYMYYPVLTEEECVRQETRSFMTRIRTGALKPMLAAFLEEENLSQEEIDELKCILDKKGEK
ncbi:MAG: BlaI/MecI/CopY family transcriptional regulator [Planctomycetes bacterium]|nr:BlaI/MecI/CopY family transcriptional regulator [Planctomycetota bacterium]